MINLHHYSSHADNIAVTDSQLGKGFKPLGAFWLSDDSDGEGWQQWCENQCFDCGPKFVREVVLKEAETLVISNGKEWGNFLREYGVDCDSLDIRWWGFAVDWARVSRQWGAVLVRLWVKGWDVHSACVLRGETVVAMGDPNPVLFRDRNGLGLH